MSGLELEQSEVCRKYGVEYPLFDVGLKLGVTDNFFSDGAPLNGLRHPQEGSTCGWYLWAGEECPDAEDFFHPSET